MLSLLLFITLASGASGYPSPTVVTSADGVRLAASVSAPSTAKQGVLLIHQDGRGKEDWDGLARLLQRDGCSVLAFDLRTQGANAVEGRSTTPADYAAMQADVTAALAVLKGRGVERISIVGAELGANLAVNAAVADPSVVSVVMLSPAMEIRGIIAADAVPRYGARPLLLVAAADDRAGARAATTLDESARGEHQFRLLERGGRGAQLLLRDPLLEGVLAGWIGAHWAPSAPSNVTGPSDRAAELLKPAPGL
jgi:alpha-beta hydrolase superfamily lysophospholipase